MYDDEYSETCLMPDAGITRAGGAGSWSYCWPRTFLTSSVNRGTERNKRRGFHNLFVFNQLLHKELATV